MINKVMFLDDDPSTNFYHRIITEEADIVDEIVICQNADKAIATLKSSNYPPEFIFLDINMPRKSGWDFLREYEALEDVKKAKYIIMVSTTQLPSDIERAKNHKLVHSLYTKPLTIEILLKLTELNSSNAICTPPLP